MSVFLNAKIAPTYLRLATETWHRSAEILPAELRHTQKAVCCSERRQK